MNHAVRRRVVDLSQPIRFGQVTHPGLPAPEWQAFRTREDYRRATGTDFQVDQVTMVGNTGTYLDSPFHRFEDGPDLAALSLHATVDLPVFARSRRRRGTASAPAPSRLGATCRRARSASRAPRAA